MSTISRRNFLGKSALGLGAAVVMPNIRLNFGNTVPSKIVTLPVGFQVWTIREQLIRDFPGTLKMMAGIGYQSVEMCSPQGYIDSGFAPLAKIKAREMKQIINDAGLEFQSTHYGMNELKTSLDERIAFASESGQKQMILSSFGLPENATMTDWLQSAEELNKMGLRTKKAGIQLGYHNHHMEFGQLDGKLIYDELMKTFDPDLVKMQFQVAVISAGFKASDYFRKYPGRFISAHLADWSPSENKNVVLGKGIVDWKEFFQTLETGGVRNIFVEMDSETFKDSASYLHTI